MEEQGKLDIQVEKKMNSVDEYQFEPIKGFPMLNWKGKRPFTSTQFYPAQLKENYGDSINDWMNKIFWGDNLQVMSHLLKEFRGQVDLVCIDPPFDSKADYKKNIKLKGTVLKNDSNSFEEKQYTDIWSNDEYLQFMYERLILIKELLSDTGSIYLHCDFHKVHQLKCIMDEIFGQENFMNEIIWCYKERETSKRNYNRKHDNILFYVKNKNSNYTFNFKEITENYSPVTIKKFKYCDEDNRMYRLRGKDGTSDPIEENENTYRQYLDEATGPLARDWFEMPFVNQAATERLPYPTQKPELLLEKFIKASSNPGDIVFDCFMGSGTTQAVALRLGRKFIGSDINLGSIEITSKRLINVISSLNNKTPSLFHQFGDEEECLIESFYKGFSVYNVNNYDVFRNPVQAKELLKEALEIQPLPNNTIYDGEKDGRMVKIMPVNRIATRADLNELISGFNIKSFEKKYESSPNRPVENLLLVCMGHEADLGASLQKEMHPYKLDVEVVDILRDKSNLEFKRDSEAEIVIENGKLIIQQFYPMNLLQKLSIMKENVEDWKELTESVKIDFNYDGAVFEPKILDVPEKEAMVKGEYHIPEDAGTIKVKITDLLSESLELTIEN
jgi:DNA modification methylase